MGGRAELLEEHDVRCAARSPIPPFLGEPTGVSGKLWLSRTTALDGAVAWSTARDDEPGWNGSRCFPPLAFTQNPAGARVGNSGPVKGVSRAADIDCGTAPV